MKIDEVNKTITTADGTFPAWKGPDGIWRFITKATPGSTPPTQEDYDRSLSQVNAAKYKADKESK